MHLKLLMLAPAMLGLFASSLPGCGQNQKPSASTPVAWQPQGATVSPCRSRVDLGSGHPCAQTEDHVHDPGSLAQGIQFI